jgi:hypothetical protein
MDEVDVGAGPAVGERHSQRVENEIGAHVGRELPAHDAAREGVDDEAEKHHPFPAAQVGEVRDPQLIGPVGREVAVDEVGAACRRRVRRGRAPRFAAPLGALDALAAHQALDAVTPDVLAGPKQGLPGASVAVGVVIGRVHLADPLKQPLILHRPGRPLPRGALIVGGRRHVQGPADRLDAEAATVLIDVAAHLVRSSSSSFAKNTLADLRISLARRSSKFS